MIKINSAHIEEFRGIRKLDIDLHGKTFAVSGPNGSGKSGVIDAIEFGLTGQIRRLTGRGTKGLTVTEHGPHVDKVKFPDAAFVELNLNFPTLGKTAKITRKVSAPRKPKIEPNDPDIRAILDDLENHPEITLARREILRFILVEPTKRSDEIQAILKIEDLGQTRSALNGALSKLKRETTATEKAVRDADDTLCKHLSIASLSATELLAAVNEKRKILGLELLLKLEAGTILDQGLTTTTDEQPLNKTVALTDLAKLVDVINLFDAAPSAEAAAVVTQISRLEEDPQLLQSLHQRSLVERGLMLVEGPECPMCDHRWPDQAHLLAHLHAKQDKSKDAGAVQKLILDQSAVLSSNAESLVNLLLNKAHAIAKSAKQTDILGSIVVWGKDLDGLRKDLDNFDAVLGHKDRLSSGWHGCPENFKAELIALQDVIRAIPDLTAIVEAQTFLLNAQQRLNDYRIARKRKCVAARASKLADVTHDAWCSAMETELDELYNAVQADFSKFYRMFNDGDEEKFTANLKAGEGRLDFEVNFYDRGLFPPGAYHSEGHQDCMGVCLYLALMKRLLGDSFTVALLDDVVMSVDADHRYQFCQLLMNEFPNTQFVIATHDRLWAEQMRSAKLVTRKTSLAFHSWTVDTGPLVESNLEVWDDINASLQKGKVETAAHTLRHHLEFVSRHLAGQLGARPTFKADGNYDLGDLLPSTISRLKNLYGKAADSAQSWNNDALKALATERKKQLAESSGNKNVEEWAINKAVHYNEWANFGKNDFTPVVQTFKGLLDCMQCQDCGSWLYLVPKSGPLETLRCQCNNVNFNLKSKHG